MGLTSHLGLEQPQVQAMTMIKTMRKDLGKQEEESANARIANLPTARKEAPLCRNEECTANKKDHSLQVQCSAALSETSWNWIDDTLLSPHPLANMLECFGLGGQASGQIQRTSPRARWDWETGRARFDSGSDRFLLHAEKMALGGRKQMLVK